MLKRQNIDNVPFLSCSYLTLDLSSSRVRSSLSAPAFSVDSELLRYFPDHADAFQILYPITIPIQGRALQPLPPHRPRPPSGSIGHPQNLVVWCLSSSFVVFQAFSLNCLYPSVQLVLAVCCRPFVERARAISVFFRSVLLLYNYYHVPLFWYCPFVLLCCYIIIVMFHYHVIVLLCCYIIIDMFHCSGIVLLCCYIIIVMFHCSGIVLLCCYIIHSSLLLF